MSYENSADAGNQGVDGMATDSTRRRRAEMRERADRADLETEMRDARAVCASLMTLYLSAETDAHREMFAKWFRRATQSVRECKGRRFFLDAMRASRIERQGGDT